MRRPLLRGLPTAVRFWARVNVTPGCWLWIGHLHGHGYGHFKDKGRFYCAHRFAYQLVSGHELKPGEFVLHTCDTPACVRPDHLYVGTIKDNGRDMAVRGRACGMERHHSAKLTADDVRAMRRLHAEGATAANLALMFGVSGTTAWQIVKRLKWRRVA